MAINFLPSRGFTTPAKSRKFDELKAELRARAEDVCHHLYPNGRRDGNEWCVGSVNGEPGKSFQINLEKGVFCEFNGGGLSGDLIDLWVLARKLKSPIEAHDEAAEWLGWEAGKTTVLATAPQPRVPSLTPTQLEAKEQVGREVSDIAHRPHIAKPKPALAWGAPPRRLEVVSPPPPVEKDSEDIAQRPHTDAPNNDHDPDWWRKVPATVYKYVNADGSDWGASRRWDNPDLNHPETKRIRPWDFKRGAELWPDGPRPLYKLDEIAKSTAAVILVEGEKCAAALIALGYTATTCAGGSSAVNKSDFSPLRGKDVVRWADNDQAGAKWIEDTRTALDAAGVKSIRDVAIPADKFVGWDCANAEADEVRALIKGAGTSRKEQAVTFERADLPPFADIARRRFVYDTIYQRGFVSITAGEGGSGKSALHVIEALAIATGRDLHELGKPIERCRVCMISLEDDLDEMHRRIAGAMIHFNIDRSEIDGWLFLTTRKTAPDFLLASSGSDGVTVSVEAIEALKAEIIEGGIGVVMIDPYVYLHTINENDNMGQAAVMKALANVAGETNAAIAIVHHSKKPSANDRGGPSSSDMRGASSIVNASRHGRLVITMSAADADRLGLPEEERYFYFRTASVKASYTPPGHHAKWFKLHGVTLPNGAADEDGDGVGVVTRWKAPDPFAQLGMTVEILKAVQAEALRACRADTPYRLSDKTKSGPWIGELIADKTGLDPTIKEERAKIALILSAWLNTGALIVDREWSDGHQKRPIIRSGPQA